MLSMRTLSALCVFISFGYPALADEPTDKRPNIVLVMTDDQGYGDIASHGNPTIQTPNLDRFWAESVRLTNFHVDPTCSPTRAALMTGRYSPRTGVWHTIMGRSLLRRDEVTVADYLKEAGYRTGIFGKWHLGDNYPFRPQDRGFEEVLIHGGGGVGQTPDFWGNDYFDDTYFHNGEPLATKGYCTRVFFDAALKFIEENRDERFFTYIPTNVPHGPYEVADTERKRYEKEGIPERLARFYGMLTNFDRHFGRLLDQLKKWNLEENTLVIFMTDNGSSEGAFNADMRGRKGSEYDGGHRVPFLARWPARWKKARDIDTLTAHIDVLPTLLAVSGQTAPETPKIDGRNLLSLLDGKGEWAERTLFVQSHRIEHPKPYRKSAVMTQRYRLVNGEELFDIVEDPGQERDLAASKPEEAKRLRDAYDAWYESCSEKFATYCEIVLGSKAAPLTTLTCHDWHGRRVPWHQNAVKSQPPANGFWAVEVERAGRYAVTLRSKPKAAAFPLQATSAQVRIGDVSAEAAVSKGATEVRVELKLSPGKKQLQTYLRGGDKERGAFFVDVEYLGE